MIKSIGFVLCALALLGVTMHTLGLGGQPATAGTGAPEGAVMRQSEFPCHEDQALMFAEEFGPDHVGCVQLEDITGGVALKHGVKTYHKALARDAVKPRVLTRYIATHPGEFNRKGAWHHVKGERWQGCRQHVGDTTFIVCADGRVLGS